MQMRNVALLQKYNLILEVTEKPNFKEELEYLHDKFIADGLSDQEAREKAKQELKRKYGVELDEYYPNMGDVDIPEGPL